MSTKLFITATDTNAGKTYVSVKLLEAYNRQGKSTLGIKPVASGCHEINGNLYNDDALALQKASSIKLPYEQLNPIAYKPAIAPHIAAKQIGSTLNVATITQAIQPALAHPADVYIIEGVGGSHTPLNDTETMADFIKANQFDVILVVGLRLGSLNHALLTLRTLKADNINVVGWIANCIDPTMENREENIEALKNWLTPPCVGIVGHNQMIQMSNILSSTMASR